MLNLRPRALAICPFIAVYLTVAANGQPQVGGRSFDLNELRTQPGFEVSVFAHVVGGPRLMAFGPNGVLYVAVRGLGSIVAIPAQDQTVTVVSGLNGPHAVAFRGNDLYVAVVDGVVRFRGAVTNDLIITSQREKIITLPSGGQHSSRTLGFGPDGNLYASVGSSCNFCQETDPRRAAIIRYTPDGNGELVYATGLRNSVGFAWHPVTGALWATDNGGDGLGDDQPPDEIDIIQQGGNYGWPDCVGQRRLFNWGGAAQPSRCPDTIGPEFELQAHSAALGISFYTANQFPPAFRNDAFVAFHGSWNRSVPTGYKVVRVRASSGRATGVEDFLWGFLDIPSRTTSGRPVHALSGPDGAVYVSDDLFGNIFRVKFTGATSTTSKVGVVRAGTWFLDGSGNFGWDGTATGDRLLGFGVAGDVPVTGDWNGSGTAKAGVFRNGLWLLDYNGNGVWDGPAGGDRMFGFGLAGDVPIVGDWNGSGVTNIGVFRNGIWFLDYNGNQTWDSGDMAINFGMPGDVPVIGDWTGSGTSKIGVFRHGMWYLDVNGNSVWDGVGDAAFGFGIDGDVPIIGDWSGSGTSKVGVFRNGQWFLDYNGNHVWDGVGADVYFGFGVTGDTPIVGRW